MTRQRLVRFAKRRTAWELTSAAEVRDIEFRDRHGQPDLRPSVYRITADEVTRCFAEHAAAVPIDPPRTALGIWAEGCSPRSLPSTGLPTFAFMRDRHEEIHVANIGALTVLVACLLTQPHHRVDVPLRDVVSYAQKMVAEGDAEWLAVVSAATKSWLKKLAP